jgi:hypothetical protein
MHELSANWIIRTRIIEVTLYLETEGILDLGVDRLVISLGVCVSHSSNSSDVDYEGNVESDGQLSRIEDLARN